jgi:hypothetical protein
MVTAEADASIKRGLDYLASRQNQEGSFGGSGYSRNIAVCGLAGLSFLSQGSTPGRGPYGAEIRRCVEYTLSHAQPSGFITVAQSSSHGPMYEHGFATLFLAEVYGMSEKDELHDKLVRAVQLIVNTQNDEGGWRYLPVKDDADISVTICQVMALRAAKNAGIAVPSATIDRCVDYVKRCQNGDGGFRYTLSAGESAFPRSAAGIVALFNAGIYQGKEIDQGLDYLTDFAPGKGYRNREGHYFYGHYYAAQAMWQAGGDHWESWYPAIREELLASQEKNGSWMDSICPEYGTAMATIVLQMPNNALPIFQR